MILEVDSDRSSKTVLERVSYDVEDNLHKAKKLGDEREGRKRGGSRLFIKIWIDVDHPGIRDVAVDRVVDLALLDSGSEERREVGGEDSELPGRKRPFESSRFNPTGGKRKAASQRRRIFSYSKATVCRLT